MEWCYHDEIYVTDLFRFKVDWLTNGYSDEKQVEKNRKKGILTEKVAAALLGVHKRHRVLAHKPSPLDIQLLKDVYGGTCIYNYAL